MNKRIFALGGLVTLLATTSAFGVYAQQGTPTPPTPTPGVRVKGKHEKHPELMKALKALERAKMDLQKADRDFGGHRAKAEQLTEQAISEVKEAFKADKK
ncbi:MAG: hypothetical protein ABJA67_04575 [Chthonomonadales bacterium]